MPLPLNKFWINSIIHHWKPINKLIQKPKRHSFNLLQSNSPYYHMAFIKLWEYACWNQELACLYLLKTWLTTIQNKKFKLKLTWEECNAGDISVWAFYKVHHHLCRPLSCVASHRGPVSEISIPVNHCNYLPVIFIASIYPFSELHLRHCTNKHVDQSEQNFFF